MMRRSEVRLAHLSRHRLSYVPRFPVRILAAIVAAKAEKALPLILAIHRQLYMTKRESTPLNGSIWSAIGSPPKEQRKAILRNLKALPGVIHLSAKQTPTSYYQVAKGPAWDGRGENGA
jgi:hypothetical protein